MATGQPSEKLKGLELPYTDDTECAAQLDPEFSNCYFISDKMCAGFYNQNTSVCKGDSGGGLVFKNPNYKNRYFIHGIVSLAHVYTEDEQIHCNIQRSALFTRVETYLEWIQLIARRLDAEITPLKHIPSIGCTTPAQPLNGQWVFLVNKTGEAHLHVEINTFLIFTCKENYQLSSTNENRHSIICLPDGSWSTVIPTCQKLCPKVNNSPIITVTCKKDGSVIPCDKATDLTVLTYKCAPYYEKPYGRPEITSCFEGTWDYTPNCIQVCGEKRVSATPLIVNGKEVERGHYPWVVALYSNKDSDPQFTNICSGTMISINHILTAAQCVTKAETGKKYPTRYFRIAAGKYYNEYNDPRDNDTAQYSEVEEIFVLESYRGEIQSYRGDIAILKLKSSLAPSKIVQPVCYHNLPTLQPNTEGVVTGWGYTTTSGNPAEKLKEMYLTYISGEECSGQLNEEFVKEIFTADKMCLVGPNNNTGLCKGDSGGGLYVKNPQYQNRYFIHGTLSAQPIITKNQTTYCDPRVALFTRLGDYAEWIELTVRRSASRSTIS